MIKLVLFIVALIIGSKLLKTKNNMDAIDEATFDELKIIR